MHETQFYIKTQYGLKLKCRRQNHKMGENLKDYAYDIRVGKDFFSNVHICVYTNTHTHTPNHNDG